MPSQRLRISDMKFFAFHGYYAEERQVGTWFSVDVMVEITKNQITSLSETVNYESIHQVAKNVMAKPEQLIETVCEKIYQGVKDLGNQQLKTSVHLKKLHPPIKGVGSSSFEISDFTS